MKIDVAKPDAERHPNLRSLNTVVLKDGPKVRKVAKITKIRDHNTGAPHHSGESHHWEDVVEKVVVAAGMKS